MIRPGTSVNKSTNLSKLGKIPINIKNKKKEMPKFSEFIKKCDWIGAIAMIDFERSF